MRYKYFDVIFRMFTRCSQDYSIEKEISLTFVMHSNLQSFYGFLSLYDIKETLQRHAILQIYLCSSLDLSAKNNNKKRVFKK